MVKYDPRIIHEHAQRLYDRALGIMVMYGFVWGLIGLVSGAAAGAMLDIEEAIGAVLGGLVLGAMGVSFGRARGFELRLEAQTALCQMQIELNGRPQAPAAHTSPTHPR